eukprot:gene15409-biopygen10093
MDVAQTHSGGLTRFLSLTVRTRPACRVKGTCTSRRDLPHCHPCGGRRDDAVGSSDTFVHSALSARECFAGQTRGGRGGQGPRGAGQHWRWWRRGAQVLAITMFPEPGAFIFARAALEVVAGGHGTRGGILDRGQRPRGAGQTRGAPCGDRNLVYNRPVDRLRNRDPRDPAAATV